MVGMLLSVVVSRRSRDRLLWTTTFDDLMRWVVEISTTSSLNPSSFHCAAADRCDAALPAPAQTQAAKSD